MRKNNFFFSSRRRHTRLQGDWSSDVCSSDLFPFEQLREAGYEAAVNATGRWNGVAGLSPVGIEDVVKGQIGRASCRGRVEISVVAGSLKKKKRISLGDETCAKNNVRLIHVIS